MYRSASGSGFCQYVRDVTLYTRMLNFRCVYIRYFHNAMEVDWKSVKYTWLYYHHFHQIVLYDILFEDISRYMFSVGRLYHSSACASPTVIVNNVRPQKTSLSILHCGFLFLSKEWPSVLPIWLFHHFSPELLNTISIIIISLGWCEAKWSSNFFSAKPPLPGICRWYSC